MNLSLPEDRTRRGGTDAVLALMGLLAIAAALRFTDLGRNGLWVDEGFTAYLTARPVGTYKSALELDTAPPLFFYLVRPFAWLMPRSEWALRWPSAALGVLAVGLVYRLARDLLESRPAALAAAALLATNRFHIIRCQDARNYSLFFTLSILAMIFLARLETPRPGSSRWRSLGLWAGFVFSAAGMVYTHNVAWFFLGGLMVSYLVAIRMIHPDRPRQWLAAVGQLAAAGVAIGLLYLPWLRIFLTQTADVVGDYWTPRPGWRRLAGHLATLIYRFPHVPPDYAGGWFPLHWAAGLGSLLLIAVAGTSAIGWFGLMKSRRFPRAVALLAGLVIGTGAIILFSWVLRPLFMDKVVIPFMVVFQIGPAALLCTGPSGKGGRGARGGMAGLVLLSLAVAVTSQGSDVNEQWREAVRFVLNRADPARDAILADERFHLMAMEWYLADSPYGNIPWDSAAPTLLVPGWSFGEKQSIRSTWRPTTDPDKVIRAMESQRSRLRRIWLLERTYQDDHIHERIGHYLDKVSTGREVRVFHHVRVTAFDLVPAPSGPP